ncbi:glycosyltransferase family 2 protein [Deinococcus sp.]|uniref:glycosyltransferase family 2 protein n=1 Tax=Deinococcus sp. TaxID=47478 RepID=UPI0025F6063C|nr:glycosyltransferase family 2 protein [Deinococcus sp.]
MKNSLVTILIPTYNRAEFLREAIQSAVTQTHRELEILILDDASPDDTTSVAAEFADDPRVIYIRHPNNLGIAGNWRAGIERVRGEFFCLLHDDDTFEPTFVESLLQPLRSDPNVILAFCDQWMMGTDGSRNVAESEALQKRFRRNRLSAGILPDFAVSALVNSSIPVGASLFRTAMIELAFIAEQAKGSIDSWLFYRCVGTGRSAHYLPERLMNYRTHSGGMSSSMPIYMAEGHLFRYRTILNDASLTRIHPQVKVLMAETLTAHGIILLVTGKRATARHSLTESLRLTFSFRAALAFLLSCGGRVGTQFALAVRR